MFQYTRKWFYFIFLFTGMYCNKTIGGCCLVIFLLFLRNNLKFISALTVTYITYNNVVDSKQRTTLGTIKYLHERFEPN